MCASVKLINSTIIFEFCKVINLNGLANSNYSLVYTEIKIINK